MVNFYSKWSVFHPDMIFDFMVNKDCYDINENFFYFHIEQSKKVYCWRKRILQTLSSLENSWNNTDEVMFHTVFINP